jgi:uncharacterized protein YceK
MVSLLMMPLLFAGCGTFCNLGVESRGIGGPRPYGGVMMDAYFLREEVYAGAQAKTNEAIADSAFTCLFLLADLPVSLAADTLTLPVTIPRALTRTRNTPPDLEEIASQRSHQDAVDRFDHKASDVECKPIYPRPPTPPEDLPPIPPGPPGSE